MEPLVTNERGFTLMELLVVIAVIAILTAIAVPTFLAQRGKANDAAVRSDLRAVSVEAISARMDNADADIDFEVLDERSASKGVEMLSLDVSSSIFCIGAWHENGKDFTQEDPLVFDSGQGTFSLASEGQSADCDGFFTDGVWGGEWEDEDEDEGGGWAASAEFETRITTSFNKGNHSINVRIIRSEGSGYDFDDEFATDMEVVVKDFEGNLYRAPLTLTNRDDGVGNGVVIPLPNDNSDVSSLEVMVTPVGGIRDGETYWNSSEVPWEGTGSNGTKYSFFDAGATPVEMSLEDGSGNWLTWAQFWAQMN